MPRFLMVHSVHNINYTCVYMSVTIFGGWIEIRDNG